MKLLSELYLRLRTGRGKRRPCRVSSETLTPPDQLAPAQVETLPAPLKRIPQVPWARGPLSPSPAQISGALLVASLPRQAQLWNFGCAHGRTQTLSKSSDLAGQNETDGEEDARACIRKIAVR